VTGDEPVTLWRPTGPRELELVAVPFTLLRTGLPAWLDRRMEVLGPGAKRPNRADDRRDAVAVLEHGSIVLEHAGGEQLRLVEGAVFTVAPCGCSRSTTPAASRR
jgi:hypothetical protein